MTATVVRRRWRAMGSDSEVVVVDGPADATTWASDRLESLEARWSRFRADSDVSRLNRDAGHPVSVHVDTLHLIRTAVTAWRESGGAVNPTVLGAVVRAGYDASFETLRYRAAAPASALAMVACTDIVIDGDAVTLPAGTGFDPGGIGKGLAADLVVAELRDLGAAGVCVNLGGDIRVSGTGPGGGGWTVAVESPCGGRVLVDVGIADGAIATSTTARRRWRISGHDRHHLIDPATGEPSTSDLVQASALTSECWLAETYAKTVLLRGSARAFEVLPSDIPALAVRDDGAVLATDALRLHLGPSGMPGALAAVGTS